MAATPEVFREPPGIAYIRRYDEAAVSERKLKVRYGAPYTLCGGLAKRRHIGVSVAAAEAWRDDETVPGLFAGETTDMTPPRAGRTCLASSHSTATGSSQRLPVVDRPYVLLESKLL